MTSKETVQPKAEVKRSKMARLGPVFHANSVLTRYPGSGGEILANQIASKFLSAPTKKPSKFPNGILGSEGSYALACKSSNQWYAKAGCCANINSWDSTTNFGDIYFFVPNIGTLSKGKKIAYIREIANFLDAPIEFVEIQNVKDGFSCPGEGEVRKLVKPPVSNEFDGACSSPKIWCGAQEWLVFKTRTAKTGQCLLVLQFLRSLYTYVTVTIPFGNTMGSRDMKNLWIYQPQMYFRLKRFFPKLSIHYRLMLSFTMSGANNVSSTYFPYYKYYYKPDSRKVYKDYSGGINAWLAPAVDPVSKLYRIVLDRATNAPRLVTTEELLAIKKPTPGLPTDSFYTGGVHLAVSSGYMRALGADGELIQQGLYYNAHGCDFLIGKAFQKFTKEGFKEAITLIGKIVEDKKLLSEIEAV